MLLLRSSTANASYIVYLAIAGVRGRSYLHARKDPSMPACAQVCHSSGITRVLFVFACQHDFSMPRNNAALGTFRLWACGYVPTTMTGTLRIRLPACSREALALPSKGLLEVTMRIDQLEDRILSHAYELYDEACRDLRIGKNLKTVRTRVARLKLLTDQLAAK